MCLLAPCLTRQRTLSSSDTGERAAMRDTPVPRGMALSFTMLSIIAFSTPRISSSSFALPNGSHVVVKRYSKRTHAEARAGIAAIMRTTSS